MPSSQNSDSTTNSTLAQLLDVDSQLSTQQAHLQAQLKSIQEKRQSLQVVINLFGETGKTTVTTITEEARSTSQVQTEETSPIVDESHVVDNGQVKLEPVAQEVPSTTPPSPTPTTVKKVAKQTNKKSQTKKTQPSKATKQAPGWQHYLREEFRNSSLPQAIAAVLHSDTKRVWDIAAVTDAIFVSEIPVEIKKKVRFQITNLLAEGVRENKWHRKQQGSYTLSKK